MRRRAVCVLSGNVGQYIQAMMRIDAVDEACAGSARQWLVKTHRMLSLDDLISYVLLFFDSAIIP